MLNSAETMRTYARVANKNYNLYNSLKSYISEQIMVAAQCGVYEREIKLDIEKTENTMKIIDVILNDLRLLGYTCSGFREGDMYNIWVSWKLED